MQLRTSFLLCLAILSLSCISIKSQEVATTVLLNLKSKEKCTDGEIDEIRSALHEDAKRKAAGGVRRNLCDNDFLCRRHYSGEALNHCLVYGWFCNRRELSQPIMDSEWDKKLTEIKYDEADPELLQKCHEQLASIENILLKSRDEKGKHSNCGKHLNKSMKFTCFAL